MTSRWQYLLTSYLIATLLLAAAVWLTWEWHWGVRAPLLGYLALCTLLFPFSRMPAETLIVSTSLWSPLELTGLLAWVPQALVYCVVWALTPIFAPIGATIHWARGRNNAPP